MYVFLLLARVTLMPHLLYIFSILVDVSCDVSVTPVDSVIQTLFYQKNLIREARNHQIWFLILVLEILE